jgi:hypothetical protein
MFVRPILALQSKGYTLAAIATLLSERGIAMTPLVLRNYLAKARASAVRKNPKHRNFAPTARRQPNQNLLRQQLQPLRLSPASRLAQRPGHRRPTSLHIHPTNTANKPAAPASAPSAVSHRAAPTATRAHPERRSFAPREDSQDI